MDTQDQKLVQTNANKKGGKRGAKKAPESAPDMTNDNPIGALAVIDNPSAMLVVTAKDLDAAVEEIHALKGNMYVGAHQLGVKLDILATSQLWKQRVDNDGTSSKYKNFGVFVETECGVSKTYAYKLIDVSRTYTEEQVKKFGASKLGIIVSAPAEMQADMMKKLEEGATQDVLLAEVKAANQRHREQNEGKLTKTSRSGVTRTAAPSRKPKTSDSVTIATLEGPHKVELFKRETDKDGSYQDVVASKDVSFADGIADLPWGSLPLENRVTLQFMLKANAQGKLYLVVKAQRDAKK